MSTSYDSEKVSIRYSRTLALIEQTVEELAPIPEHQYTSLVPTMRAVLREALMKYTHKLEKEGAIFP